jgi:ubiquinone/menaquinone biosynthesis C-methylase UbiE
MDLDVGCGCKKHGDIGIDISRNSAADVIADAQHLPFKDCTFGSVISTYVIEHSPNPLIFLQEQHRVLRSGGRITVQTDNAQYYAWSVLRKGLGGSFHYYAEREEYVNHYMIFYPKNIVRLLSLAGFKNMRYNYIRRRRKTSVLAQVIVKLRLWREECLFMFFKVEGTKNQVQHV